MRYDENIPVRERLRETDEPGECKRLCGEHCLLHFPFSDPHDHADLLRACRYAASAEIGPFDGGHHFPPSITPFLVGLIESIYDSTFGMISVSAIVTIWSAGKGILALMRGLNAMNGVVEDRNYVFQRLIASFYLVVFLVMVVFSLVVMVFGNLLASVIVNHVPGMENLFELLLHFRGIFTWLMLTLLFAVMYTFIPNCRLRFAWQIPGAAFSAVSWNVFSWGFSIYVRHSGGFDMYGSLTTIVILMLWLYFCFYLFLIGAHINRFLTPFRKVREKQRAIRRRNGFGGRNRQG